MDAVEALALVTRMNLIRDQVNYCSDEMMNPDEGEFELVEEAQGPIVGQVVNDAMIDSLSQLHPERVAQLSASIDIVTQRIATFAQTYLAYQQGNINIGNLEFAHIQINASFATYGIVCETIFQVNGQLRENIELADDVNGDGDEANENDAVEAVDGAAVVDANNDNNSVEGAG